MRIYLLLLFMICYCMGLVGCATPGNTSQSHTQILSPDQADDVGGSFLGSNDIRTISQQMCTELLALPDISGNEKLVIATDKIANSTRYLIDTDILMKKVRLELNKYSDGKIRFLANQAGQNARKAILTERNSKDIEEALDELAQAIVDSSFIKNADKQVVISLAKIDNTNLYNMNADSFAILLRSKIKQCAGEKIVFTMPGSDVKYDYLLTGQFYAESLKTEGVANTVNDLKWAEENQEKWRGYENSTNVNNTNGIQVINGNVNKDGSMVGPNAFHRAISPELWESPNVKKTFNVMLVNNDDLSVFEKAIDLEKKIDSGKGKANYILTGEISSITKSSSGVTSDYIVVEFVVIDPETNDIILDYGYETKKQTSKSVLYR